MKGIWITSIIPDFNFIPTEMTHQSLSLALTWAIISFLCELQWISSAISNGLYQQHSKHKVVPERSWLRYHSGNIKAASGSPRIGCTFPYGAHCGPSLCLIAVPLLSHWLNFPLESASHQKARYHIYCALHATGTVLSTRYLMDRDTQSLIFVKLLSVNKQVWFLPWLCAPKGNVTNLKSMTGGGRTFLESRSSRGVTLAKATKQECQINARHPVKFEFHINNE